jgi:quinol monooxygenase YgiN
MLIIAGAARVPAADRDAYVAAHTEMVARARTAEGCLDVAITTDPIDPGRVNVYERWTTQEALDAWRAVAHAPDLGVEVEADDVLLFTVTDARPPFG